MIAILIAGPTASGKSTLAMALADQIGGIVINCDSMQVYSELQTLTARPSQADMDEVPHRLYGHVPAAEAYSAGRYESEASAELEAATASGRIPIFVGGTGLYFRVLLNGLSPIPPVPSEVRSYWREQARELGSSALHAELARRDAVMGERLVPSDTQRIVRALEVLEATGRSLAEWQEHPGRPVIPQTAPTMRIVVGRDRRALYQRADDRFRTMLDESALEEVRELLALRLDPALPAMRALGVRPLIAYLEGRHSLETAVEHTHLETRHYIKRQLTWLRRFMSDWKAVDLTGLSVSDALAAINARRWLDATHVAR